MAHTFKIFSSSLIATLALAPASVFAQASSGGSDPQPPAVPSPAPPTSTLDMSLDTGAPAHPEPAQQTAPNNAPSAPSRAQNVRGTVLSSRSATYSRSAFRQAPAPAPQVLAQLGTVVATTTEIRIARDPGARLLSIAQRGVNLAVVADGGLWWGVLMVNNTMGWVPKAALQLLDYHTPVTAPSADPPSDDSLGGAAGSVAGALPSSDGLDTRTTTLLREAFSYLGVPYVWAGTSRSGLDCSGFVCSVFGAIGVKLPRHSGDQARVGQSVSGDDLRPGDRLYFDMNRSGEVNHCGIYIGNALFIHSSTNHGGVAVDSILKPNYRRALVCARRS